MNIVTRKDLRGMLNQWQAGHVSAQDIHRWAEARYQMDDWDAEDRVANEVLWELDTLDMNLTIVEDVTTLLRELECKTENEALELKKAYFDTIDYDKRQVALRADPLYAPFCKER